MLSFQLQVTYIFVIWSHLGLRDRQAIRVGVGGEVPATGVDGSAWKDTLQQAHVDNIMD